MSVTGHKSSPLLEIYQKVNAQDKIRMGHSLGTALTTGDQQTPCTHKATSTVTDHKEDNSENFKSPPPKMPLVEVPNESDPDFNFSADDILSIVEQCEKASEDYALANVNNSNNQVTMTSNILEQ